MARNHPIQDSEQNVLNKVFGNDSTITWADGNAEFDNVATDLTSLTYS